MVEKITSLFMILSLGIAFPYHGASVSHSSTGDAAMMCDMPGMAGMSEHDHHAMMVHNMATMAQGQNPNDPFDDFGGADPQQSQSTPQQGPGQGDQPGDTPTHRFSPGDGCSSVNPNAPNKERDGVNPNTVGCKCAKTCVNGRTQEDRSKDEKGVYICKNASHKDRCSCPDPCKS